MKLGAWFKRYYQRHKAFRDYYCDTQILKLELGCLVAAIWVLFETLFTIKASEYQNVNIVHRFTILFSVLHLCFFALLFLDKLLLKKIKQLKGVIMEVISFLICVSSFITCGFMFISAYHEGGAPYVLDPMIGWIMGWTLYTLFCYFSFYWYTTGILVGYLTLFLLLRNMPLIDWPENFIVMTILLLIGGIVRYNLGRKNFEISEENRRLLESDRLTGVYNRRSYEERIAALREGKEAEVTLVLFDVNGLKPANDTHGHLAGDELIIATANCISKVFDAYGKCFRIGGDEFVVVMDDNAEDINKLMKQFDETTAQWKGNYSDTLSVSYGIAQGKTEGDGISELIKTADANMYEAKRRYYVEHGIERRVTV